MEGAPYRSGVGIITSTTLTAWRTGMGNANVFVKINGIVLFAAADVPVHAGQKVLVTYRMGKSGAIYVASIGVLTERN